MNYWFGLYKKQFGKEDEFLTLFIYNDVVKQINIGDFKFPVKPAFQSIGLDRLKESIRIILNEHKDEARFYLHSDWYKVRLEKMG
jgi:hypothetical protein